MSQYGLPGGQPIWPAESLVSTERQPLSDPAALSVGMLEHGAYYAGKFGVTPAVARWHAKKRRFVLGEFSLGRQTIKSLAHIAEGGTAERFTPLSKTAPKDASRISDYAFETAT